MVYQENVKLGQLDTEERNENKNAVLKKLQMSIPMLPSSVQCHIYIYIYYNTITNFTKHQQGVIFILKLMGDKFSVFVSNIVLKGFSNIFLLDISLPDISLPNVSLL